MKNHRSMDRLLANFGDCIDYPVTGIISFERKLLSGNGGKFFLFHLMKNHRSVDRLLATLGIVLITP
jgi:hypothetical protein